MKYGKKYYGFEQCKNEKSTNPHKRKTEDASEEIMQKQVKRE